MDELPEAWEPIVKALLEAPVAWQTPAQVAAALGRDTEETLDLLCLMDVAGWIGVWETEPGPCVLLSPLAAERLHVHLVEVGPDEVPRWGRIGDPSPAPPKARHVCRLAQAAALDALPDPHPSPDLEAERSEEVRARSERLAREPAPDGRQDNLPSPTLLLGQRLTPWPGPARMRRSPCPACGGRTLRPHEYCLGCDRWGLDALLPSVPPPRIGRPARRQRPGPSPEEQARRERLQAERERQKRKARRKAKIEAERLRKRTATAKTCVEGRPAAATTAQDEGSMPASDSAL